MIRIRRREFLAGSAGTLLAFGAASRSFADVGEPVLVLDFAGSLPEGATFRRPGPAAVRGASGYTVAGADEPRFETAGDGRPALLLEGALDRRMPPLSATGTGRAAEGSPFGEGGDARQVSAAAPGGAPVHRLEHPEDDHMVTASVFARADEPGEWTIALRQPWIDDVSRATGQVGGDWTRIAVSRPAYVYEPEPLEFHLAHAVEGRPGTPAAILWGAQVERGFSATSPLPPGADRREADDLRIPGTPFERPEGNLTMVLPDGGTRGGVLLEAASGAVSFSINESGRLVGRVGAIEVEGFEDAGADTVVELSWSPAGVGVASGGPEGLLRRAFTAGDPGTPSTGGEVRLMAAPDGGRASAARLARLEVAPRARVAGPVKGPVLVPSGYEMVYGDDFDDPDTSRINEEGRGEGPGPFWRSRYRWSRFDIINQEKQVYMDRAFAGTGSEPLGVDPFSISNGVLGITARRTDERLKGLLKGALYTSGAITTERIHSQTYGYFEMRCRIPHGRGFWPAFWLLPVEETWPPEIDPLEGSGARPYSYSSGAVGEGADWPQKWLHGLGNLTKSFHTYAMEWTESDIVMFFDGQEVRRAANFVHQPMFVLANLAVGSHEPRWIPDPDETTPDEGTLEIDFIRCWARA